MTQQLITRILCDKTSEELNELALDLQINDEPLAVFCDKFDLGDWFYEKMIILDKGYVRKKNNLKI